MRIVLLGVLLARALFAAAEPAMLETGAGTLYGTLEVPPGKPPFPVVLIIAGSGPTDRDGNSAFIKGKNDSLKMIAEALATKGIASLRYDKRGVAESAGAGKAESDLRFDMLVDDASAWGRKLRLDARFGALLVLGHSEGSLIGMLAARFLKAEGFISLAGAGRPAGVILREQLKAQLTPEMMSKVDAALAELEHGRLVDTPPPGLSALFRKSVQPYLVSWLKYDPAREISKLTMPVLIAQGANDVQVSVEDARLLSAARPGARLLILDNMNHVLKDVPTRDRLKQMSSYGDPSLPVDAGLVDAIVEFTQRAR